jgi:hypothetical protein
MMTRTEALTFLKAKADELRIPVNMIAVNSRLSPGTLYQAIEQPERVTDKTLGRLADGLEELALGIEEMRTRVRQAMNGHA